MRASRTRIRGSADDSALAFVPTGAVVIDPSAGTPPLPAGISLGPQPPPLRRCAKGTNRHPTCGEGGERNQPRRPRNRRDDEPHQGVDDRPSQELAEGSRVTSIGPAQVPQVSSALRLANDRRRVTKPDQQQVGDESTDASVAVQKRVDPLKL